MAQLSAIDLPSLLAALHGAGYDIVKIGDVPDWMERITVLSTGLELYAVKG